MKQLTKIFSHLNLIQKADKEQNNDWSKPIMQKFILESQPKKVKTYDELVIDVAQILHRNRNLTIYYRGQGVDYKVDKKTIIYPSIYRKTSTEKKLMLKDRFIALNENTIKLRKLFSSQSIKYAGTSLINKYPEIAWSLLQHYEICPTPLLDLTHSLHVACSFAFFQNNNDNRKSGIIYLLGMPWQTDAIGYNTYEELVNIKLLSVCPPKAQRPFFQEGYLAGPFPNFQLDNSQKVEQFDFARRLVAKFEIPLDDAFWGDGFYIIPQNKLYQPTDEIKNLCESIKGL